MTDGYATHGMQRKHHLEEETPPTVTDPIVLECSQTSFDRLRHLTEKEITVSLFNAVYTHSITIICKASVQSGGNNSAQNLQCDWTKFCLPRSGWANETL